MFLLDTNVVSELRRARPHGAVLAWLEPIAASELYISAVTLGELQAGVEITRQQDAGRAAELDHWVDLVEQTHAVLPLDGPTFRLWARMLHGKPRELAQDAMIAATAAAHALTVATRNVRDFAPFGVPTVNPFA